MWLTKGRAEPGPVFGNKGTRSDWNFDSLCVLTPYLLPDEFTGLGIFLDT
jgi:hypothetical protein